MKIAFVINQMAVLLTRREKRHAILLLFMILVMAFLDTVGVASIIPFMAVLGQPELVQSNVWLNWLYQKTGHTDTSSFLFFLGVSVFILLFFSITFKAFTQWALLRFTHMRNHSLSSRLFKGYLACPYSWYLNHNSADLSNCILFEVSQIINGVIVPAMQLIAQSCVALFLTVLLFLVDPIIALTSFVVLGGAYTFIYLGLRRYLGRIGRDRVAANKERFRIVQEALGGIKDVKIFGAERELFDRFSNPSIRFARHQANNQILAQMPHYFLELIAFGGILFLTLYLFRVHGDFRQVLPVLAVYTMAGYRLLPALQQVFQFLAKIRFGLPVLELLHKNMMEVKSYKLNNRTVDRVMYFPRSEIVMSDVSFTYPEARNPIISGFSIRIPAKATTGLIGATGSGKTTIVDLLMGLLSIEKGELRVDGELIGTLNQSKWQRSLGYVPQHIFLADDTVSANIAFGLPQDSIDMKAVETAARIAEIHDFISEELPEGYQSLVGERGVRLSGGQRQRIGIARALYHDPSVLVFDEATSALDSATEQAVMKSINKLSREKTVIMIAHRLSTVRDCDLIYRIDSGRVVAQGSYDQLVWNGRVFDPPKDTEAVSPSDEGIAE